MKNEKTLYKLLNKGFVVLTDIYKYLLSTVRYYLKKSYIAILSKN